MTEDLGLPKKNEYYIPDKELWDIYEKIIRERFEKVYSDWNYKGSLDNLILNDSSGKCNSCKKELIRVSMYEDGVYFAGGIICCPISLIDESHKKEYYIEVWPDLNSIDTEIISCKELIFNLSNSIIKPCYFPFTFALQNIFEGNEIEKAAKRREKYESKPFPEPNFRHK
ncbi:MAG: hypothetical protein OQK82_02930 [Candidatus Pacearchaeota archaeon]|nr:hypothetical protein [Candidatus Pacearchaeota archaeon]